MKKVSQAQFCFNIMFLDFDRILLECPGSYNQLITYYGDSNNHQIAPLISIQNFSDVDSVISNRHSMHPSQFPAKDVSIYSILSGLTVSF